MKGVVEFHNAPRFLALARWRCLLCNSPWFAARSNPRAWELLHAHEKAGCP